MEPEPRKRVYSIWPSDKEGKPGGSWRQHKRWLVLDVTNGLGAVEIIAGPMSRNEALTEELRLRTEAEP